jgi:hypothetical protein
MDKSSNVKSQNMEYFYLAKYYYGKYKELFWPNIKSEKGTYYDPQDKLFHCWCTLFSPPCRTIALTEWMLLYNLFELFYDCWDGTLCVPFGTIESKFSFMHRRLLFLSE